MSIWRGQEDYIKLRVINTVDDDPVPSDFTYISRNVWPRNLKINTSVTDACKCTSCQRRKGCDCLRRSAGCWYNKEGRLAQNFPYRSHPALFECSSFCSCDPAHCRNRSLQNPKNVKLLLKKTQIKNWGVFTSEKLKKGRFLWKYIGEVYHEDEANEILTDSYSFAMNERADQTYILDASRYGNISRFVNHSCKPNLVVLRVYVEHRDLKFPHLAFFTKRVIKRGEELTIDYGQDFWLYKDFPCACGEKCCKYSAKTIKAVRQRHARKRKSRACICERS